MLTANNKTNKMKILRTAALIKMLIILPMIMMAQNGFIRGIVYDDQTTETLPGVTVFVEGTSIGSISDFDGKFSISISPGIYDVSVSFISYETLKITGLKVESGKTIILDNLRLKEARIEIQGVEITAEALRNTEASILAMKMKSANLADGISAAHLRKIGDSDAASSIKRVPGVSLQGGKYVFVRG
ncbi:MAG: TonB-dependent receptor, partial [Sphingobacteriia bacterium]|nr:TonB-dependent receptor [Sphingobacteriia bacterium]